MKIQVTEEDIKKGEPGSCEFCAISQALRKKFNALEVYTEYDHEYERVLLHVNNFIEAFDIYDPDPEIENALAPPRPLSFTIYEV